MFDEFEELQNRIESGSLTPEIFQFLRNLMQHEDRVDFIFSGTHKLEELGAEYWSILFNIAVYKQITFLAEQDIHHLIHAPVADTNLEYDPLAIERIIHVTAGHPYFTQLVLHEMVSYHNEKKNSYLTVADVDLVLERIVERREAHFKYIWSEATPDEREVLRGLTELLISDDAASGEDRRALLKKRGYESEDNWEKALTELGHRDMLTHRSVRHPRYHFEVDLVRLWIEKTRPGL